MSTITLEFIHTLRQCNIARCEQVFHPVKKWSPTDWAAAMAGELGEACTAILAAQSQEKIGAELADMVIYADFVLFSLDLPLFFPVQDIGIGNAFTRHTLSLTVSMAGSMGQACNAVKKFRRFDDGTNIEGETPEQVKAQVNEYIMNGIGKADALATYLRIDLRQAIINKFNEVSAKRKSTVFLCS